MIKIAKMESFVNTGSAQVYNLFKYLSFSNIIIVKLIYVISIHFHQEYTYIRHVGAAVPGIPGPAGSWKPLHLCKRYCTWENDCLAINHATNRSAGSSTVYESGTCIHWNSSAFTDHSNIDGYKNLDCYVKIGMVMRCKMLDTPDYQIIFTAIILIHEIYVILQVEAQHPSPLHLHLHRPVNFGFLIS